MKKPFVLIAAIVAVVGLGAVAAVAKETINFKTSVSIELHRNPGPDPFSGQVKGDVKAKKGCQNARRVVLRQLHHAGVRGSDRSDDRGRYRIVKDHFGGERYFVTAKRNIIENDGAKVVCKKDRSKVVKFEH